MTDTPDTNRALTRLATETWASFHIRQKRELEAIERERDELRERVVELENAIRMTIARFDQVKWGDDGDCGSAVIVGLLEWALPENQDKTKKTK
jgi:hypothetical protein